MKPEPRLQAFEVIYADDRLAERDAADDLSARAERMVAGVREHGEQIDGLIDAAATGWRIERLAAVDRSILRLGTWELLYTDTPPAVVIDEAVELAKQYSTAESGAFVNGVLERIRRDAGSVDPPV